LAAEDCSAANEARYFLAAVFFLADLAAAGFAAVFVAVLAGAATFAAGTAFFAVLLRPRAGLRASAGAVVAAAAGDAADVVAAVAAGAEAGDAVGVGSVSVGMS
jgi:hypothetical protein